MAGQHEPKWRAKPSGRNKWDSKLNMRTDLLLQSFVNTCVFFGGVSETNTKQTNYLRYVDIHSTCSQPGRGSSTCRTKTARQVVFFRVTNEEMEVFKQTASGSEKVSKQTNGQNFPELTNAFQKWCHPVHLQHCWSPDLLCSLCGCRSSASLYKCCKLYISAYSNYKCGIPVAVIPTGRFNQLYWFGRRLLHPHASGVNYTSLLSFGFLRASLCREWLAPSSIGCYPKCRQFNEKSRSHYVWPDSARHDLLRFRACFVCEWWLQLTRYNKWLQLVKKEWSDAHHIDKHICIYATRILYIRYMHLFINNSIQFYLRSCSIENDIRMTERFTSKASVLRRCS